MTSDIDRLLEIWQEIHDLDSTALLLSWDQETMMPPGGDAGRAEINSTIAGLQHRLLTSPELGELLERLETVELDPISEAQARQATRRRLRAVALPEKLVKAMATATSLGVTQWRAAREAADFSIFADSLREIVGLKREEAGCIGIGEVPYDALLDEFEPGLLASQVKGPFAELERELPPLIAAVRESGIVVDETPARGNFPLDDQLRFGRWLGEQLGFDFHRGRLDRSTHPFCVGIHPDDVRLTWRGYEDDFRSGIFGLLHEAGHGLYEAGLPAAWHRSPLGGAASFAVHESQSRLWENHVGRHPSFWEGVLPHFIEAFPEASELTVDRLWPTLHTIQPSFIRVEADEVTYHLHILVRFQIESALFAGQLEIEDLPGEWDDAYERLLGIRPPDDSVGVLQDVHWSSGLFGYFPTYSLGSLLSTQLFETAEAELGSFDAPFSRLEFGPLLEWLRKAVHCHGSRYTADELTLQATGAPLSTDPFLRYARAKARRIYGIE